jgi:hypothetical protein
MIAGTRVTCDVPSYSHVWHRGTFVLNNITCTTDWYADKEMSYTVDDDDEAA